MSGSSGFIHGTAFLLGEIGLLALGRSGSGKSMLAAGLAVSPIPAPFALVADDRVRVLSAGDRLVARPVAGFLGRIEIRGLGMAELPAMPSAVIRGIVRLMPEEPERMPDQPLEKEEISGICLPRLQLREGADCAARFLTKWPHFRRIVCQD
jgi:serine kinase of HPr protein (carbohydrate metabolism regulator)